MRLHSLRLTASIVSLVVFAALLATPATTFAASAKVTFSASLGANCVGGDAPNGVALHLVWKSTNGALKANAYVPTGSYGGWEYCSPNAALTAGDSLKATVGSYTRHFVMPNVAMKVDRVHDNYHGTAPAGTALTLWFIYNGCCPDYEQHADLIADANGRWSYTEGSTNNYYAHVDWSNAAGDHAYAEDYAPSVSVTIGRSVVSGTSHPNSAVKIVLRDGTSGLRIAVARAATDSYGSFSAVFLDGAGHPATVATGNRVDGRRVVSDMYFITPDITASADIASDIVTGNCPTRGHIVEVEIYRSGNAIGGTSAQSDNAGDFSVWFGDEEGLGYRPANIRSGDRVVVTCSTRAGDFVTKRFPVS
jgi:hypothetical protein